MQWHRAHRSARPGPGCRISGDLTSCSSPSRTAGTSANPVRAATCSGLNFLPHHEPMMMSGAARTISCGSATMRSLARLLAARCGNTSSPPAMPISSLTQRIALIAGSSHSSKYTRGRRWSVAALARTRRDAAAAVAHRPARGRWRPPSRPAAARSRASAATERWLADPHLDAGLDQRLRDVGLDVGKADRQIGLQLEDAFDLGAGERADLGLFLPRARRAHREARDADDAPLFAERIQHLGRLLGQADDAFGQRGHHERALRLSGRQSASSAYTVAPCQARAPHRSEAALRRCPTRQVRHLRQILLWPLRLVALRRGDDVQRRPWELLAPTAASSPWREVVDEYTGDADGFHERHYNEFVTFLPYVQRFLYGEGRARRAAATRRRDSPMRVFRRDDIARGARRRRAPATRRSRSGGARRPVLLLRRRHRAAQRRGRRPTT